MKKKKGRYRRHATARQWNKQRCFIETPEVVEVYMENGVRVQRCAPRAAYGVFPLRRV